jgi:hypothetical protein
MVRFQSEMEVAKASHLLSVGDSFPVGCHQVFGVTLSLSVLWQASRLGVATMPQEYLLQTAISPLVSNYQKLRLRAIAAAASA